MKFIMVLGCLLMEGFSFMSILIGSALCSAKEGEFIVNNIDISLLTPGLLFISAGLLGIAFTESYIETVRNYNENRN